MAYERKIAGANAGEGISKYLSLQNLKCLIEKLWQALNYFIKLFKSDLSNKFSFQIFIFKLKNILKGFKVCAIYNPKHKVFLMFLQNNS